MKNANSQFYTALIIGLMFTSFASIFIKLTPASGLIIAFWRQLLATIGIISITIVLGQSNDFKRVNKNQIKYLAISGIFLAFHFGSWIVSLFYTSIAESLVLVDSSPLIVLVIGIIFLKESVTRKQIFGILVSLIGGLIIAVNSLSPNSNAPDPVLGNFLAFFGAITFSGYIIIGRLIRNIHNLGIFVYTAYVYGFSTITLFLIALILEPQELLSSLLGQLPIEAYGFLILLALFSSVLGHSLYNYALKEIKAAIVSITTLGEPIISSILAILILNEFPTPLIVLGGGIVIFGVAFAILNEESSLELVQPFEPHE